MNRLGKLIFMALSKQLRISLTIYWKIVLTRVTWPRTKVENEVVPNARKANVDGHTPDNLFRSWLWKKRSTLRSPSLAQKRRSKSLLERETEQTWTTHPGKAPLNH